MTGSDIASLAWHPYRPHLFDDDGCFDSVHHHMHVRRAAAKGVGSGLLDNDRAEAGHKTRSRRERKGWRYRWLS
jgi:hypothetical protein